MNRGLGVQAITFLATFLFLFITLSSTIQSVPPTSQEILIVDINGSGEYINIQDAIDNANSNDIIRIKEGVYTENNLEIRKKVTIVGDKETTTIIDFGGNNGFILESSHVDIRNLKLIDPGEYAIFVKPDSDWCNISHSIIEAAKKNIGIRIRASFAIISNCNIIGVESSGTGVELQGHNNTIKDCDIYGFTVGVLALIRSHDNKILNCNIFNNEIAIDIRINSYANLVSKCNIYVNDLGVYIWQNSNNNLVYLNNFWKNDIDAKAQGNNTWDNGIKGNYWNQYTGVDTNGDEIWDTPYTISEGNIDRFPLTSIILPDEITLPTGVEQVTPTWDDTPSFIWSQSVYSKGVKGYYVKINSRPETYVGDTSGWTSPYNLTNGVHTFYVRAIGTDNTTSRYAAVTFLIDTTFIDTDGDGWSDEEEQQYGTDPYDLDNYPLDTDRDRTPDSVDIDDDNDGYNDEMELSYETDTKDPSRHPLDTDGDDIPDEDSPSGKYTGDVDDDDDNLRDTIETRLGSNPKNGSDAKKVYITGKPYYLVDVTQNGVYDIFYEPTGDITTAAEKHKENYFIDENGDGTWDYIYNTADGSMSPYEEEILPLIIWIPITLAILLIILIITLYFTRFKYWKYKIFKKREEIIKPPSIKEPSRTRVIDKDTVEMISQTKNLLQHIQQDVEVYMEQLHQLEDQIEYTTIEGKKETTTPEEKTSKLKDISDIEEQVDELLSREE
ncbi:MAG: right-handed parallel beta-helix repeat-containing protein [Thermoplasmatales archaeon]|nr:MAG: right-handed parallel beta-helix repeat-containing protein [Thermoplasmatales archaeon]